MDGAIRRGIGSLLNHNPKKANCRFSICRDNTIAIVAIKHIKNFQELYLNYGKQYIMNEPNIAYSTNNKKYNV